MSTVLDERGCGTLDYLTSRAEWVRTYPAGRVCAHPGCGARLSVYNPESFCAAHEPEPDMHYCGMDFGICEDCGEVIQTRKDRPSATCRMCANERHRQRVQKLNDERRGVFAPDRVKTCPVCGESKPMTSRFWSVWTRPDGTQTTYRQCRACRNKQQREAYQKAKGTA